MYKQLTEDKRLQIWAMRKEGKSQSEIARVLAVHRSTVSRELNRNSGPYGYEPQLAQRMAIYRKKNFISKLLKGSMKSCSRSYSVWDGIETSARHLLFIIIPN